MSEIVKLGRVRAILGWARLSGSPDVAKTAFVGELEREIAQYSRWGKMNNLSDIALTMVSIVGSIAAAVVAAALSAACTSYQRMVQLRERASLHFE